MMDVESWTQMVKKHKTNAQGHLQRQNAEVDQAEAPYSHLARYLLEEFAFGGLSANQVQKLSMMAKLDGIKHTSVDKLSSLGSNGKHLGNIHRDLLTYMTKYLHPIVKPEADCVNLPLQILKGEKTGTHNLPHYYLAPHKLLAFMYNKFNKAFQDKISGQDGAME